MRIKEAAIVFEDKVWTGPTHAEIIKNIVIATGGRLVRHEMQGFVDDNGGFYSRADAGQIALHTGQVKHLRGGMLYSEDLLKDTE